MNSKRLLAVDVDLTVCPSDEGWWEWCNYKVIPKDYQYKNDFEEAPYDLSKIFPTVKYPFEYWRELDYSQFQPIEGSVEALEKLSKYFGIVFISSIKGNHTKSKYYWLKEHFPFMEGYIATKEKYLMNNSVVAHIDDRKSMLKGFDFEKRILFNTPYEQEVECETTLSFDRWNDEIVKKICEEYV